MCWKFKNYISLVSIWCTCTWIEQSDIPQTYKNGGLNFIWLNQFNVVGGLMFVLEVSNFHLNGNHAVQKCGSIGKNGEV